MKRGDKVAMTMYGTERTGVVADVGASGIIHVVMDDTGRTNWFFPRSVRNLSSEPANNGE